MCFLNSDHNQKMNLLANIVSLSQYIINVVWFLGIFLIFKMHPNT